MVVIRDAAAPLATPSETAEPGRAVLTILVEPANGFGASITVKVKYTTRIEKLRQVMAFKLGVDKEAVEFAYIGTKLEVEKPFSHYGLTDGSVITVAVNPTGC